MEIGKCLNLWRLKMTKYEIRKDGIVYCSFNDETCMYSKEVLKGMKDAGYRLYIDGKLANINKLDDTKLK
jgi:hypothetical protein